MNKYQIFSFFNNIIIICSTNKVINTPHYWPWVSMYHMLMLKKNAKTRRNQVWVTTEWTYGQNDTESGGEWTFGSSYTTWWILGAPGQAFLLSDLMYPEQLCEAA